MKRVTDEVQVRIIRSARRVRTVSGRLVDGGAVLEIAAPARATDAELAPLIDRLRKRLAGRVKDSDAQLAIRARELNTRYLDGRAQPHCIRYVSNQHRLFGSCTTATREIRISDRLATMPDWVRDYVILHELAHLIEGNHGPRFWALVSRYPKTERARGFLMATGYDSGDDTESDGELK